MTQGRDEPVIRNQWAIKVARLDVDENGFADGLNLMVPARKAA